MCPPFMYGKEDWVSMKCLHTLTRNVLTHASNGTAAMLSCGVVDYDINRIDFKCLECCIDQL
jgi:hypothetical protein